MLGENAAVLKQLPPKTIHSSLASHLTFLLGCLLHQYLCQNGKFSSQVKCFFYMCLMICKQIILCSGGWLLPGGQVLPAVDAWFNREGALPRGQGRHREAARTSCKNGIWGTFVARSQSHLSGVQINEVHA